MWWIACVIGGIGRPGLTSRLPPSPYKLPAPVLAERDILPADLAHAVRGGRSPVVSRSMTRMIEGAEAMRG